MKYKDTTTTKILKSHNRGKPPISSHVTTNEHINTFEKNFDLSEVGTNTL